MQELRIKVDTNEKKITLIDDYKVVEKYIETADESIEGNIFQSAVCTVSVQTVKNHFRRFEWQLL